MQTYMGIDVHAQSCTLAIVNASGKALGSDVVATEGAALVAAIKRFPGERHVCLEEGTQSAWLVELLAPHVQSIAVVQPGKSSGNKSDAIDAKHLADRMRRGELGATIFKGYGPVRALRAAVRCHRLAVRDVARVKVRLRALYRSWGVDAGREVYRRDRRDQALATLPEHTRALATSMYATLDALESIRREAESLLELEAGKHADVTRLMTVPGIGLIRAAQIVAIVVSPQRFRTRAQFWAYCGLAVVTRSSADWVRDKGGAWVRARSIQTRGLNRNRHPLLKEVFKGAAISIIQHCTSNPWHESYQRSLREGTKPTLARLTLARRIAATVLAIWKNKEVYKLPEPPHAVA